jgi:hypothetical protein
VETSICSTKTITSSLVTCSLRTASKQNSCFSTYAVKSTFNSKIKKLKKKKKKMFTQQVCVCERERERERKENPSTSTQFQNQIQQRQNIMVICDNRDEYLHFRLMDSQISIVVHVYYVLLLPRKLLLVQRSFPYLRYLLEYNNFRIIRKRK